MNKEQKLFDEIESYRETIIKIDANNLVSTTIKHWNFLKYYIELNYHKNLSVPEMSFSNNDFRYPEITLYWDKYPHHLDLEIEQDRENIWVYYHNESSKEEISYWYKLENILEDRLIDKLLLFTEEETQ
jgi:hypothetical protein